MFICFRSSMWPRLSHQRFMNHGQTDRPMRLSATAYLSSTEYAATTSNGDEVSRYRKSRHHYCCVRKHQADRGWYSALIGGERCCGLWSFSVHEPYPTLTKHNCPWLEGSYRFQSATKSGPDTTASHKRHYVVVHRRFLLLSDQQTLLWHTSSTPTYYVIDAPSKGSNRYQQESNCP